jgi:hypothetical protein
MQTHLEPLFSALAANPAINLKKCSFAIRTLEILGHMISAGRFGPNRHKHRHG